MDLFLTIITMVMLHRMVKEDGGFFAMVKKRIKLMRKSVN